LEAQFCPVPLQGTASVMQLSHTGQNIARI
jgi:hypothetical protein